MKYKFNTLKKRIKLENKKRKIHEILNDNVENNSKENNDFSSGEDSGKIENDNFRKKINNKNNILLIIEDNPTTSSSESSYS